MEIHITTIPHSEHRPEAGPTVGDWQWSKNEDGEDVLTMRVSQTGDWRQDMLIAYHEFFEALACKQNGVDEKAVDAFDSAWTEHDGMDEPGDDPQAPYYSEHQGAMVAERHLANYLGVNWIKYEQAIESLFPLGEPNGDSET
jgi:hypothetical protein